MLFGTRAALPMIGLLATVADWPPLPRQQPGRQQPAVSPSYETDVGRHGDRRPDGLRVALAGPSSRL